MSTHGGVVVGTHGGVVVGTLGGGGVVVGTSFTGVVLTSLYLSL